MTIEEFYKLLQSHDWYYYFSDDPSVYDKGKASHTAIVSAVKTYPTLKLLYKDYQIYAFRGRDNTLKEPRLEDYN